MGFIKTVAAAMVVGGLMLVATVHVHAASKSSTVVKSFEDPYLGGITCDITWLKSPSEIEAMTNPSISCKQTGKITGSAYKVSRKDLFVSTFGMEDSEVSVSRLYNKIRGTVTYLCVTYQYSGGHSSHSLSKVVVSLN